MKIEPSSRRGVSILALLFVVNVFNLIDRQLPYILLDSIRADLSLTDAQVGLMAGVAFAVVFSFGALVLGRIADRFSSRLVLSTSLVFWSLATAFCGVAQNFFHLILARACVAAGESGTIPAAHAFIAHFFPARNHAFLLGIFSLGVPIGTMLGLVLGGWIHDVLGWRQTFLVIGLPGVIVGVVAWICIPESHPRPPARTSSARTMDAVRYLFALRSFRHMAAASALLAIAFYAIAVFAPAFLMRTLHASAAEAGLALGIANGIGGTVGMVGGGALADMLSRRDERWRQLVPAFGMLLSVPAGLGAWLASDMAVAVVFLALVYLLALLCFAPLAATVQLLAPDDMRATSAAIWLSAFVLIGASVGPYAVGWASDFLAPRFGLRSLRYALCLLAIPMAWSALHFFFAARALAHDVQACAARATRALGQQRGLAG